MEDDSVSDNGNRFREFWDRVLKGEEEAGGLLFKYIEKAVQSVAARRPGVETESLVQSVARTIVRRAKDDKQRESVAANDFRHFFNLIRKFGQNKLNNEVRKIYRRKKYVREVPMVEDDDGEKRPIEPADDTTVLPEERLVLEEWSEACLEAVEQLDEPNRTIMKTLLEIGFAEVAESPPDEPIVRSKLVRKLHERLGGTYTETALYRRVYRIGQSIGLALAEDEE